MADRPDRHDRRRLGAAVAATLAAVVMLAAWPPTAQAAEAPVAFTARIDGRSVTSATERRPLRLDPKKPLALELVITNRTSRPVAVRTIRLAGTAVGLTFFGYETTVGVNVAPGDTVTRRFSLDLAGLAGQGTGLIPGSLNLLDARRHRIASQSFVVDVRGSLRSVYGVFALALVVFTALSIGGALQALSRNQLSVNRWHRGLRFLPGGLGLGLSVVFTLSALRLFVARTGRWVPIVLVAGTVLFLVGYFTPTPEGPDDYDDSTAEADANWWQLTRRG